MRQYCPHCGHKRGKLEPEQVRAIRCSGEKNTVLALQYGVSEPLISMIKNRKAYLWVGEE